MGKSPHHIQSTRDFVNRAKGITLHTHTAWCTIYVYVIGMIIEDLGEIEEIVEIEIELGITLGIKIKNVKGFMIDVPLVQ